MEENNPDKKSNIYTKEGDKGKTKINKGKKIGKEDPLVKAWGALDELEAKIGHLRAMIDNSKIKHELKTIQTHLHIIMAQIKNQGNERENPEIKEKHIEMIEQKIDNYTKRLPEIKKFIYTSGARESTYAQVTRTTARKVEIRIVELDKKKDLPEEIKKYTNRLSDYLFTVARYLNYDQGFGDEYVEYG